MTDTNTSTNTVPPTTVPMEWEEFVSACTSLGEGMFIATVQTDSRPHLAWVMPGWADGRLWFATFRNSQKAVNLRSATEVALHWPTRPDAIAFCRAKARLVDDSAEASRLWDSGILPYELGAFFSSREDPLLLFVELTPSAASLSSLDPTVPRRRWEPSPSGT